MSESDDTKVYGLKNTQQARNVRLEDDTRSVIRESMEVERLWNEEFPNAARR